MTSTTRFTSASIVLKSDNGVSPRILELRKKIHNREYIDNAVQRIAQVISKKLIDEPDELKFRY